MREESERILIEGANEVGIPLTKAQIRDFDLYMTELIKWNQKLNLTSLEDEIDIIVKHFIDSLTPLAYIGLGSFVMDIGSGAGFPGVPMKITRPDLRLMLLESKGRKVSFLNNIIRELKLKNIRAISQRADSEMFQNVLSEHLDVTVARAFGDVESILDISAPYLKPGGKAIVMKGPRWREESSPKKHQKGSVCLVRSQVVELELPVSGDQRALLIYEKN